MIIRVFEYRVAVGVAAAHVSTLVSHGFPALRERDGLLFAYAGRDPKGSEERIVVTGWRDWDAIRAVVGEDVLRPTFLPEPGRASIVDPKVSHWIGVELPAIGSGGRAGCLRLVRATMKPGTEAAYAEHLRARVWPRFAEAQGLVAAWVGIQDNDGGEATIAIGVWHDVASMEAALDAGLSDEAEQPEYVALERIAHFDVIDQASPLDARPADRPAVEADEPERALPQQTAASLPTV